MTRSITRINRKLFLLALIVNGLLFVAPERSVNAYEQCIPDYNSCNMMCETVYGENGITPDPAGNVDCQFGCMSALSQCQARINPEERDQ